MIANAGLSRRSRKTVSPGTAGVESDLSSVEGRANEAKFGGALDEVLTLEGGGEFGANEAKLSPAVRRGGRGRQGGETSVVPVFRRERSQIGGRSEKR
jgi:hypothetical protein